MSTVRIEGGVADGLEVVDVFVVWPPDIGDSGNDLSSDAETVEDLVCSDLVCMCSKERGVSEELAADVRVRIL